jgi:hypothetical protein
MWVIPARVNMSISGLVCGLQYIHVYGALSLSDPGSTFSGVAGTYSFTKITVYDGGRLESVS